ncbi:MAG: hypothetical protein J0M18_06155 [Ignavibacteria bacterium]|jgi:hypothetical protein|nr:hypothetical protein [Ignavibacteria bacterium]
MKTILLLINFCFIFYMATLSGCNCGETPTGIEIVPTPSQQLIAEVAFDSIGSAGGAGGLTSISKTTELNTIPFAFDTDSIRIKMSYKGSSTAKDTLFYIYGTGGRLYTLIDNAATDPYKNIDTIFGSTGLSGIFRYTIQARSMLPYITIKDLKVYKR